MHRIAAPSHLLFLAAAAQAQGQRAAFTPELVAGLRSVGQAALAPDGARAAYTLSVPRRIGTEEDGAAWSELWLVEVASGHERAYVSGQVNVSALTWTPDGREL